MKFDTTSLQALQADKHLQLLDVVDGLRAEGLNEHVDLPQLIVCGDQSSGKSSVLAAISGVPFPKKDNLCTRFATEVNLRKNNELQGVQITVSIMPSTSRALDDRKQLEEFRRELDTMEALPGVMEDAAKAMGIGQVGGAFSADVLRLEVRGPNLPQLTIVDLPGLVHSENRHQSEEDIRLVSRLVDEYMRQERSIILAVVSARYDYPNQIVLAKARKVDPEGKRTLGIITKPDTLYPGSGEEASFIALAKNLEFHLTLGWHVVRNLDSNQPEVTNRDFQEDHFFSTTVFKTLDRNQRGIRTLRDRLSSVLFQQIRKELPSLIAEIANALEQTSSELARMGPRRATYEERLMFLMELGQRFQALCLSACDGQYEDAFFDEASTDNKDCRRLRAVLQNRNIDFAQDMLARNPTYSFRKSPTSKTDHRISVLTRATQLIKSHRGKELPGTFNPLLIGKLFGELSVDWLQQTQKHVDQLWLNARSAVTSILATIADEHVEKSCMSAVVDPQLEKMRATLTDKLVDYMQEFRRHPITYDTQLTDAVQKVMKERSNEELIHKLKCLTSQTGSIRADQISDVVYNLMQDKKIEMDAVAAETLTDYAEAYYTLALKRLNDEVPAHVIEPVIMTPLPKLLESTKIYKLSRETVDLIGGESNSRMKYREVLQAKLEMFDRSSVICKIYSERNGEEFHTAPSDPTTEPAVPLPMSERTNSENRPSRKDDVSESGDTVYVVEEAYEVEPEAMTEAPTAEPASVVMPEVTREEFDDWSGTLLASTSQKKKKSKKSSRFAWDEDPQ